MESKEDEQWKSEPYSCQLAKKEHKRRKYRRIPVRGERPPCHHGSQNHHRARNEQTQEAQLAMPAQFAGRGKRCLNDQEQNPRREYGTMDMYQKGGKRCQHEARKQVALSKTKDDDANDSGDEKAKIGVF
jgi:hypothetical protein